MMNEFHIPAYLKKARLMLLSKKSGACCKISDTRGIQLLTFAFKVIDTVIYKRVIASGIFNTGNYQAGFKAGHSCKTDQTKLLDGLNREKRRHLKNRGITCLLDISAAFDCVIRKKLWHIIDDRIDQARKQATINMAPQVELNQLDDMEAVVTLLKELYREHAIVVGDSELPTHNGVMQGAVNSPWLFSLYLEYFLYSCPKVKALCTEEDILAFADDLFLHASSWSDLKGRLTALEKALEPGSLIFNKKKSELMTKRNKLQPTDEADWQTDAEDNEDDPKPSHTGSATDPIPCDVNEEFIQTGKKRKQKKPSGSQANPICIEAAGRKNSSKDVPRTEISTFFGINIVPTVKYLGLMIEPQLKDTVTAVRQQVRKYVDVFKAKTKTGIDGLDKSIVSAYIKSLCCCFLPPLVAIGALTKDDISQMVASMGKQAAGIQRSVPNRVYNSLNEGGPNGTVAQVMAEGAKLKAFIKKDHMTPATSRRAANQEAETTSFVNKFKPAFK